MVTAPGAARFTNGVLVDWEGSNSGTGGVSVTELSWVAPRVCATEYGEVIMEKQELDQDRAAEAARAGWISVLGKARPEALKQTFEHAVAAEAPAYTVLRAPEIGLVMTRGRVGGRGDRFNFGEVTATRCVVRLESGEVGVSYRMGRDKPAAEIAALFDAMRQSPKWAATAERALEALAEDLQAQQALDARRSGATKVQFFTMTRAREQK